MSAEPSERDAALILDMALAARDAIGLFADLDGAAFLASRLHQNAVIHSLAVIGEAAGKVSTRFRMEHQAIPWREITGMRHRLIHAYADVRLDVVWAVVETHLPLLLATLEWLVQPREEDRGSA